MTHLDIHLFVVFLSQPRLEPQYCVHHMYLTFLAQCLFISDSQQIFVKWNWLLEGKKEGWMNMVMDSNAIMLIQHGESWARSRWLTDILGHSIPRENRSSCPGIGSSPTSLQGPSMTAETFPLPRVLLEMASSALQVLGPRPAAMGFSTRSGVGWHLEKTSRLILSCRLACRRHANQWPFPEDTLRVVTGRRPTELWLKTYLRCELKIPPDIPSTEGSQTGAICKSSHLSAVTSG